jgi:hypothetical protein
MKEIASMPNKDLTAEARKEVFEFIAENIDETTINFDLRVQQKIENFYLFSKETWKELAKPILNTKNESMQLIKRFISECVTLKDAERSFREETGLCRQTFYNYRKKLLLSLSNTPVQKYK